MIQNEFVDTEKDLKQRTICERIDQLPHVDPANFHRFINEVDGTILATRKFWVILSAYSWQMWEPMGWTVSEKMDIISTHIPVNSQPTVTETLKEIKKNEAVFDKSEIGKGKKNRFQSNMTMIAMLGREVEGSL
jgi:hypothetical protein